MSVNPQQLVLLANLGLTLLRAQNAERILKVCLSWLGADPDLTMDGLTAREEKLRKKTLGFLLKKLEEHFEFKNGFEITISEFLEGRNLLAHHFQSLPGYSLDTDDGRGVGMEFLNKLGNQADLVRNVILGLNQMFINKGDSKSLDFEKLDFDQMNEISALMFLRPK